MLKKINWALDELNQIQYMLESLDFNYMIGIYDKGYVQKKTNAERQLFQGILK